MKEGEGSEEGNPRGSALIIGGTREGESRGAILLLCARWIARSTTTSRLNGKQDYNQRSSDLFAKFSLDSFKGDDNYPRFQGFSKHPSGAANRFDPAEFQSSENTRIPTLVGDEIRGNKEGRSCFPFFPFAGDDSGTPRRLRARGWGSGEARENWGRERAIRAAVVVAERQG